QYLFRNQELATRALRVIAHATREFSGDVPPLTETALETDLTFLGFAGMMDAPRADAIEAIRRCKKAGIRVVMITGDHKLTAMAIAREMGILEEGKIALTGEELEKLSDEELLRQVERIRVYARVAPEHKMRIVDAWKKAGHIVAMTGDGVNDAPALKRSNLGVAMGIRGPTWPRRARTWSSPTTTSRRSSRRWRKAGGSMRTSGSSSPSSFPRTRARS